METNTTERGFIPYPTNRVVGTISDAESAAAAVEALVEAGFDRQSVDVLRGEEDLRRLDPTGAEHGLLERLQRALIRTGGPVEEYKHLTHHVEDVRAGRSVLMVLAPEREQRIVAADILNAHGAEFVGFYGRWAWQGLTPNIGAADSDAATRAHGEADRPEDIPRLFGWPRCYFDGNQRKHMLAPEYGGDGGKAQGPCAQKKQPLLTFPAHWAPNGMAFYSGSTFPAKYRGGAFVSFHGSHDRSPKQAGYLVAFVPFETAKPAGRFEEFATGFAGAALPAAATDAPHRPMGVAVGPDGALYVSDDVKGRIWRIIFTGGASH